MSMYRDLIAWQKAMDLTTAVYTATSDFPKGEQFGLTLQMRRAAVSIPSNIAEGHGRQSKLEFARFLKIALGSTRELETQIILAGRLHYGDREPLIEALQRSEEVAKIINGLLRKQK